MSAEIFSAHRPLLAVSMGDPVGIGPEVIAKALSVPEVQADADYVVFGDVAVMQKAVALAHLDVGVEKVESPLSGRRSPTRPVIYVIATSALGEPFEWARSTPAADRAQIDYIEQGVAAIFAKAVDGICTGPISKSSIARAGSPFPGHTEMLASLCAEQDGHVREPVMMLAGDNLKVVPLTVHVALADVPKTLTIKLVAHGIRVTHKALISHFGRKRPRIAVAGLNPHAGESGMFGNEEATILEPAIAQMQREGVRVSGPMPADTVFRRALQGEFDVVIGMYHDQALIPLKLLDFDRAVNVTLGLPLLRTSVDHGTAYDLAGKGVASAGSMIAAMRLLASMVRERRRVE